MQITKKRRSFKWKDFFLATYFYFLVAVVIVSVLFGMDDKTWNLLAEIKWENIMPIVASSMLLPDIISKLIFSSDSAIIDSYIKTRPIKKRTWIRFVSIAQIFNFWTLAWALPLAIICFFIMPFGPAIVSALLLLSVSFINSMAAVMFRTAQGWEWKWAVVVGWLMWWSLAFVHGINFFGMSLGVHITYFFVLIAIGIYLELHCLGYLRSYDENKKKKKEIRKSSRSAFFIEMRPFLRGKRLRMVFVLPVIFLAQSFWYAAIGYEDPDAVDRNMFLPLAIMVMPLMALQLTFALEGNYFDGVWTRPINIEKLLLRKYYTAMPMAVLSFLILLISHFLYDTSIILMVGSLLFTIGFSNLLMLTFCFHTKAIDIFASGFMNTQGNDYSISSFATTLSLMLITMALIGVLPPNTCGIIFGLLGIMGFAVHKYAISWIAHRYEAKRYKHFERYRNK